MKRILLSITVFFLNIIYFFHKLCPVRSRISFVSRQSEEPSLDARLLMEELRREMPGVEIRFCCRMIPPGLMGKIRYGLHLLGPEMHAVASSRVVILEGYCVSVSALRQRKSLRVLQMWHAMGVLKRYGNIMEGEEEGYSRSTIRALHMHRNYDVILSSSEFCRKYTAKAFNYPEEKVRVMPLPRTDLLRSPEYMAEKREEILREYPELVGKKIILYAPTFRKGRDISDRVRRLLELAEKENWAMIAKLHPLDQKRISVPTSGQAFSSMELLSVCDYVISDYSAFIFEAAVAGKPLFLYAYDLDEYIRRRGFLIDYEKEMPTEPQRHAEDVIDGIRQDRWDPDRLRAFANRFVAGGLHNTEDLAGVVKELYENV